MRSSGRGRHAGASNTAKKRTRVSYPNLIKEYADQIEEALVAIKEWTESTDGSHESLEVAMDNIKEILTATLGDS